MKTALTILSAVLLDAWLGEPKRWHPLVGFGRLAHRAEHYFYATSTKRLRRGGVLAAVSLLAPFTALSTALAAIPRLGFLFNIASLYFAIAPRSLIDHAEDTLHAFQANDPQGARARAGRMVSRDTCTMEETGLVRAVIESVLENGNDAAFGAMFYFLIGGAPGAVLYRLTNTLDAMWGYRTPRYREFGWAAARFDDVLNYIPARLTALTYALSGTSMKALRCWRSQGRTWESSNAGSVMAAGAGALNVTLGGPAIYHGAVRQRPILGTGQPPEPGDIDRAVKLLRRSLGGWCVLVLAKEIQVARPRR